MSEDFSVKQRQSIMPSVLGGATLGAVAGYGAKHFDYGMTAPKYASHADIIKEAEDKVTFSSLKEKYGEKEETKEVVGILDEHTNELETLNKERSELTKELSEEAKTATEKFANEEVVTKYYDAKEAETVAKAKLKTAEENYNAKHSAYRQLMDNPASVESQEAINAKAEVEAAKKEVETAKANLETAKAELANAKQAVKEPPRAGLLRSNIEQGEIALKSEKAKLAEMKQNAIAKLPVIDYANEAEEKAYTDLKNRRHTYNKAKNALAEEPIEPKKPVAPKVKKPGLFSKSSTKQKYQKAQEKYQAELQQWETAHKEWQTAHTEWETAKSNVDKLKAELEQAKSLYSSRMKAYDELYDRVLSSPEIQAAEAKYNNMKASLDSKKAELKQITGAQVIDTTAQQAKVAEAEKAFKEKTAKLAELESKVPAQTKSKMHVETEEIKTARQEANDALAELKTAREEAKKATDGMADIEKAFQDKLASAEYKEVNQDIAKQLHGTDSKISQLKEKMAKALEGKDLSHFKKGSWYNVAIGAAVGATLLGLGKMMFKSDAPAQEAPTELAAAIPEEEIAEEIQEEKEA